MIGKTERSEICCTDRGIVALLSLQVSCLFDMYKQSGNYFVIVETIFFIQNFEFIEKITQKFHNYAFKKIALK